MRHCVFPLIVALFVHFFVSGLRVCAVRGARGSGKGVSSGRHSTGGTCRCWMFYLLVFDVNLLYGTIRSTVPSVCSFVLKS